MISVNLLILLDLDGEKLVDLLYWLGLDVDDDESEMSSTGEVVAECTLFVAGFSSTHQPVKLPTSTRFYAASLDKIRRLVSIISVTRHWHGIFNILLW